MTSMSFCYSSGIYPALKWSNYSIFIRRSIVLLVGLWEEYIAKDEILKRSEVPRFGITDASLQSTVDRDKLLLTDDGIKSLIWRALPKGLNPFWHPLVHPLHHRHR